jgi:Transposase domain (DUF772)
MSPARHVSDEEMDAATWCRHLVPQGSVYAFLADHRHQLFPPELFADVARQGGGHPSVPAEVVGSVMVLQALEGLSDREATSALRRDIAWKVACGLRLDDEGFHPTVLVYWRARLRASTRPRRIFDAVRQVVEATGVLTGRGRRVLDSTILADAVATQDTVTQLVAAIRRVRRLVPGARQVKVRAHDDDRPGKPDCAWDDPEATQALGRGWSTTPWRCWRRSPRSNWTPSRPRRSRCWRWLPARTSSRASAPARGGSPAGSPRIGSSQSSTRRPATPARPAPTNATATRATSPPSPSPGW